MKYKHTGALIDGWEQKIKDEKTGQEQTKKHDPTFTGYVELKVPPFPVRARFPKQLGLEDMVFTKDGADQKEKVKAALSNLDVMAKASELLEPLITEVSLVEIKTGIEIKTVEDLYSYPPAATIISELCSDLINGFQPKN